MTGSKVAFSVALFMAASIFFIFFREGGGAVDRKYIRVDGSSTVLPITEAIAEEYRMVQQLIHVAVGASGTGGGFKKFLANETDINNASRSIRGGEILLAQERGVNYLEIPVAYDGITVIVNKNNDWVESISIEELKKIWKPGSQVKSWKDVRETWPDKEIKLFGPGPDSGTFDYFTKVVNGKTHASRSSYTMSENDNIIVRGVSGNKYGLGYLGYVYYTENKSKLKALAIEREGTLVFPDPRTIKNGSYKPLSRPIFIYVSQLSSQRSEVRDFVHFYLAKAESIVQEVGYIPLSAQEYGKAKADFLRFIK